MSLAVFILPQGDFLTLIKKWKDKIDIDLPNQKYTLHPPFDYVKSESKK